MDNPDLTEERTRATFRTEKLAEFMWGGAERRNRKREIADYVEAQGEELRPLMPTAFMSREQKLENVARLSVAMMKHAGKVVDIGNQEEQFYFNYLACGSDGSPHHLHFIMAVPAMVNNCDEEQAAEWLPKLFNCEIIGTYAQTELGHGTNLSKLETTAIYEPATQEFVLHSPTVTSTKWWPGNMGKSANFVVVVALLYSHGKCYGPHNFWVQIRDLETHKPLPGIIVGDIGPKFGFESSDNGFLRFDHVRIPRRNMLMKHAKITPSGEYIRPVHPKVGYTSMMYVRSVMIHGQSVFLGIACTIAIRYSCVRRQGEIQRGAGEVKVLDYQTQQYRLFPQLARFFAMFFAGGYIRGMYRSVIEGLNTIGDAGNVQTLMADLHSLSSGLKAVCSFHTALGIEQCRMACGGHGYSQASSLPQIYAIAVGGCTYEGENMVMLLQLGRFLMKQLSSKANNDGSTRFSPVTAYLFKTNASRTSSITQESGADVMLEAFEHLARRLALRAFDRIKQLRQMGRSQEEAWNETGVDLTKASRAHTQAFLARNFVEKVKEIRDEDVGKVINDLLELYLNYELLHCAAELQQDGYLTGQQIEILRTRMFESLRRIRPNAVAIMDALEFTDRELMYSVLGRRDGHVYDNLLKWAQQQPINQTDVLPFHEKYLGKAMKEARERRSKL